MVPGMIILWSGSIETIPCGFHLCDGDEGTPDLRTRFVLGAWPSVAPGSVGGGLSHTHDFLSDGHFHELLEGDQFATYSMPTMYDSKTTPTKCSGTTYAEYHLPPWYALCYIMKL